MEKHFLTASIQGTVSPNGTDSSITEIITRILNDYLIPLAAILAVGFVMYGGFLYITSAGDPAKTDKAKKTLMWAILGVILVVLSLLIVKSLDSILNNII